MLGMMTRLVDRHAYVLMVIALLATGSGCATYALRDSIRHSPGADAKRYPGLGKGRYNGIVRSSGKTYDVYSIENMVWKAPEGGRGIDILMPADGDDGEAVLMSSPISPDYVRACQGLEAQAVLREFSRVILQQKQKLANVPAYVYFTRDATEFQEDRAFGQIPLAQVTADSPRVLGIVMANPKHPKSLLTARLANPGQAPPIWHWSKPRVVRECLVPAADNETILRNAGFLGYLVTVPVDVVTSPLQLIWLGIGLYVLRDGLHY
jgi:hypothetical protein